MLRSCSQAQSSAKKTGSVAYECFTRPSLLRESCRRARRESDLVRCLRLGINLCIRRPFWGAGVSDVIGLLEPALSSTHSPLELGCAVSLFRCSYPLCHTTTPSSFPTCSASKLHMAYIDHVAVLSMCSYGYLVSGVRECLSVSPPPPRSEHSSEPCLS